MRPQTIPFLNAALAGCTALAIGATLLAPALALAAAAATGDYGTVSAVDAAGVVTIVPWGKTPADSRTVATGKDTAVSINKDVGKWADLKEGMWIKLEDVGADGAARKIIAGQFIFMDGDKMVIFKGLPEEFILYGSAGWYTNAVDGFKFKFQAMRAGPDGPNAGANLRPAGYKEPPGGFVVYFPLTLKGAVLNYEGAKPGAAALDAEGKFAINKDTVTESYWKHPKNPNQRDAGFVSGLTELTIRKLPKREK